MYVLLKIELMIPNGQFFSTIDQKF